MIYDAFVLAIKFGLGLVLLIIAGLVAGVFGWFASWPLYRLRGAEDEEDFVTRAYIGIVFVGLLAIAIAAALALGGWALGVVGL